MAEARNALPVPSGTGRSQPLRVRYRGVPAARSVPCVRPTSDDTDPFPEHEAPVRATLSRPERPAAASWGAGNAVRTESFREATARATAGRPSPALPRPWGGRLWGSPVHGAHARPGERASARKVPESCPAEQGISRARSAPGLSKAPPAGAARARVRPGLTAIDHPEQPPLSFFPNTSLGSGPSRRLPPAGPRTSALPTRSRAAGSKRPTAARERPSGRPARAPHPGTGPT